MLTSFKPRRRPRTRWSFPYNHTNSANSAEKVWRNVIPADRSISVGWEAVKKDWEAQFNFLSDLKVTQADGPHVSVKDDVAWATGIANAVAKSKTGADVDGLVYESDVFEKREVRWLLVSHTALAVPEPM